MLDKEVALYDNNLNVKSHRVPDVVANRIVGKNTICWKDLHDRKLIYPENNCPYRIAPIWIAQRTFDAAINNTDRPSQIAKDNNPTNEEWREMFLRAAARGSPANSFVMQRWQGEK